MAGLDTNVLVRWLTADDAVQTAKAEDLFRKAVARGESLFIPITVTLELEWVLRSRYGFDRDRVLSAFNALLETQEFELQTETALERALALYRRGIAEFADCLHAGSCDAAGRTPLLTFDVKAARLAHVDLVAA